MSLKYKVLSRIINGVIREVLDTADFWTEVEMRSTDPKSASYAAERIKYKARKDLIRYITRSYGELN